MINCVLNLCIPYFLPKIISSPKEIVSFFYVAGKMERTHNTSLNSEIVSGSCNFDSGLCNWSINSVSKTYFRWKRCRSFFCDGPAVDHTLGSSEYKMHRYVVLFSLVCACNIGVRVSSVLS
jgi:hypothetical protein